MGKIKKERRNNKDTITRTAFDDRYEFVDNASGKLIKTKIMPVNVQKFKKYVKETGELGV